MLRKIALATLAATSILAGVIPASLPAAASSAGESGRWTKLGRTTTNFAQPGMARRPADGLHALWAKKSSADASLTDLVHTRITGNGEIASTDPVVSDWNFIWSVPDLAVSPVDQGCPACDSYLVGIWGGIQSTQVGETHTNISAATWHPVGTSSMWNLQDGDVSEGPGGAASSIGVSQPGDTALFTWAGSGGTYVHGGFDPSTPDHNFQTPGGGCCSYSPDLASTMTNASTGGQTWVAWYSSADGNKGVWTQQVDPSTGAPFGSATRMPGSTTRFNGEEQSVQEITRTPIAADQSGMSQNFYVAYTGGYPSPTKMIVWRIDAVAVGGPAADSVVVGRGTSSAPVHTPAIAADDQGHAWVMWSEGGTGGPRIFARRSNVGGTRWGATVMVDLPRDTSGCQTITEITPETMGGNVDVIATISEGCTSQYALWHTEIEPGLSLSANPSKFSGKEKVTFKVTDAGEPVQGAKVTVDGKSATTDADGIAHIVLGPYARDQKLVAKATHNGYVAGRVTLRAQN